MKKRVLYVDLNGYQSLIRGWGSRELLVELKGRPPTYVRPVGDSRGGWSVQETTARSLIALAEHRNFDVVVIGRRATRAAAPGPVAMENLASPGSPSSAAAHDDEPKAAFLW